jgi:hypothetical protein
MANVVSRLQHSSASMSYSLATPRAVHRDVRPGPSYQAVCALSYAQRESGAEQS